MNQPSFNSVFNEVENPLVRVLVDMEYEGVKVDTKFLSDYSKVLEVDAKISEERVYEQAGVRFNLASPKQLGEVLFEILKSPITLKTTSYIPLKDPNSPQLQ